MTVSVIISAFVDVCHNTTKIKNHSKLTKINTAQNAYKRCGHCRPVDLYMSPSWITRSWFVAQLTSDPLF